MSTRRREVVSVEQQTPLRISVTFPHGAYSGSDHGSAEELPAPARLHEALVAAAAGGPWARLDSRVLVACDEHRAALEWLEQHEPIGIVAPRTELTRSVVRRYRWRASPVSPADTDCEPRSALDGSVVYVWPSAPQQVVCSLAEIAQEVTHVGRADSIAIVRIDASGVPDERAMLVRTPRRGPGRVMRIPRQGRTGELVRAHVEAVGPGGHGTGSLGKQAPDELVTGANEAATALRRFADPHDEGDWPFAEAWALRVTASDSLLRKLLTRERRVGAAVGIHRAIVNAIGTDVPSFITGRDGEQPMRGAGHLAIHLTQDDRFGGLAALLGIPPGVADADREALRAAFDRPLRAALRDGRRVIDWFRLDKLHTGSALGFWEDRNRIMRTETPLVLEATGGPHRGTWSIEDAVVCSVGYAMRGVLERSGMAWGTGWAFRTQLVASLREELGVRVVARRAAVRAGCFVHRVRPGDLVVAVDAAVDLGKLAPRGGGLLALGRARHLGGGLLVPLRQSAS
jgi:CRISPR-associated protein Csb2